VTRWARVTPTHHKKLLPPTSWENMAKKLFEGTSKNISKLKQLEVNRLTFKNNTPQPQHTENQKKKEYLNRDVNGLMDYLRQSSQTVHNGKMAAKDSEAKEENAEALKEGERLKRQAAEQTPMVGFQCDCPAALENKDISSRISCEAFCKCVSLGSRNFGKFPFTKCFIWEIGYLSRSFPNCPKGLCAISGGCKLCGFVEHFKKDSLGSQNSDQMVTAGGQAKGLSRDCEEILDALKPQNPQRHRKLLIFY
uniref:Uncharacterized protein n=1 Tax=Otolemur garnettii TaxID=30611 RepID=H0XI12_OTOGA